MEIRNWFKQRYSGAALVMLLSIAAIAISQKYASPVMLFAILIGLSLHPSYESKSLRLGIDWCARPLLLTGVALLGFRVNVHDFLELGWLIPLITIASLVLTILVGTAFSKAIGLPARLGVLISGAVSICGVSAAVAISTALPKSRSQEHELTLTVAGVTAMSTLAMLIYPLISEWLNHSSLQAGLFIGATIHDVAQVVGAGFSISDPVGNSATLVKLIRISSLLPVVMFVSWAFREKESQGEQVSKQLLPPFLIAYLIIAAVNSSQLLPSAVQTLGVEASKYCLIASLVAIGIKTDLGSISSIGRAPLISLIATTLFLAVLALLLIHFLT